MVRIGKFYRDFLDGTFQSSITTTNLNLANRRADTLRKRGYLTHVTSERDPVIPGISKDRLPDGYPFLRYTVWQRKRLN